MMDNDYDMQMRLIPMSLDHTSYIVEWRNDPENAKWFTEKHVFTPKGHEKWLTEQLRSGTNRNWILVDSEGVPVGAVALYDIDARSRKAEFGRLVVGRSYQGRGFGPAAVHLAIGEAAKLGLSDLYLVVKRRNIAAISIYDKAGFRRVSEGQDEIHMELKLANSGK